MNRGTETNDLTNQSLNGFSILHRLGVGGMSEVYLAFQQSLRRHVALKVLRADFVGSDEHEQRFLQEARAVASLMHPNIVQVYDVGKFESIHYIAQEYVPGSNLSAFIQRRGALPIDEAVSILWQATAGLQKAASIGLVHRDIKPDNLLLTADGEVKVADFGLARARGQNQNLTAVGVTLGTPLYMSPEQIQGMTVDSRSDLYSLGATAYHMLSGRPPFSGETPIALAMQHVQTPPVSLSQIRPDLPKELVGIVHKLLSKSPDDRYGSAAELSRALRLIIDKYLEGRGDKMIPFVGLVVDHQAVIGSEPTQELQTILDATKRSAAQVFTQNSWIIRVAATTLPFVVGALVAFFALRTDVISSQHVSSTGIVREPTIERQYAVALLVENDLKHWIAVSDNFPPKDAISRNYQLKAELQIARLFIEREEYNDAEQALRKVLNSPSVDDVMRTIARIEIGFVLQRLKREPQSREQYDKAIREISTITAEKVKLIRDALPSRVRADWEKVDLNNERDVVTSDQSSENNSNQGNP